MCDYDKVGMVVIFWNIQVKGRMMTEIHTER